MQTKLKRIAAPKVIKNYFLLYYSNDHQRVLQEIYAKAASLLESSKGFYISSDIFTQEEQLLYLALAKRGIEWTQFVQKKLLKRELFEVMFSLSQFLGVVELSETKTIQKKSVVEDIQSIAKDVNAIFIESFSVESLEDLATLQTIRQLAQTLGIRIEIGIVCSKEWLQKLHALTSYICMLS